MWGLAVGIVLIGLGVLGLAVVDVLLVLRTSKHRSEIGDLKRELEDVKRKLDEPRM
jgi:uncharacterized membrane-anchored protein YhcB (DUF1043 family)